MEMVGDADDKNNEINTIGKAKVGDLLEVTMKKMKDEKTVVR